ncbi:MAG: hypothetical protein ACXVI1_12125, partial [Halobacteriota archaeon]
DKNLQSEKDFGRKVQSNSRIIGGLSTQRARRELHDNAGASVEDDNAAHDLEEGNNPGEDSYPVDYILKHMSITGYSGYVTNVQP